MRVEARLDAHGGAAMHPVVGQASGPVHFMVNLQSSQKWLETGLLCSAGKREFRLDRYHVAPVAERAGFRAELEYFRREVVELPQDRLPRHPLGRHLGLQDGRGRAVAARHDHARRRAHAERRGADQRGDGRRSPSRCTCPVTGEETIYEFFPVAFCRNAANRDDPLYDPSLERAVHGDQHHLRRFRLRAAGARAVA